MYKIIEIDNSIRDFIKYLEIIVVYNEMRTPLGQQGGDGMYQCLSLILATMYDQWFATIHCYHI